MYKSGWQKLLVYGLSLIITGCAEQKYLKTIDQICPPSVTQADAMTTAEKVLREMHFVIEKYDVEAGYIRTLPLSGAQSFEFWRTDSVGSFNQTEADLQSIRRTIELSITQQAGPLCISCMAATHRLSSPQNQTTIGQGRLIMSPGQKSLQKLGQEQKPNITWIDLGRDNQLETEILKRIEKKLTFVKKEPKK